MTVLALGLIVWIVAHLWKRIGPASRASAGSAGKGIVAVAIIASVVLMVIGYRDATFVPIWSPPSFFSHINNLLMLIAVYVYFSTMAAPNLWIARIKHPQLAGFKIWAFAHLLVNADVASILLFGGLLFWAVFSVVLINKQDGPPVRSETAPIKSELVMLGVALVAFIVIVGLHTWLGPFPLG